jgi:hypothetical protein
MSIRVGRGCAPCAQFARRPDRRTHPPPPPPRGTQSVIAQLGTQPPSPNRARRFAAAAEHQLHLIGYTSMCCGMGEYFDGAAVYAVHRHASGRWSVWAYEQQEPSRCRVCRIAVIDEPREAEMRPAPDLSTEDSVVLFSAEVLAKALIFQWDMLPVKAVTPRDANRSRKSCVRCHRY